MSGWVARGIRCAVSVVFMLAGAVKVYPFTEEYGKNLMAQFRVYASVYPLGFQPDPLLYLYVVACLETLSGMGLMFSSGKLQKICCGILIFIMLGYRQTLVSLKEYGLASTPLICAGALVYIYSTLPSGNDKKKKE